MENKSQSFRRHSRAGTVISAIGLVAILLSVLFIIYKDRERENILVKTDSTLFSKNTINALLKDSLNIIKQKIKADNIECVAKQTQQSMHWTQPQYKFAFRLTDTSLVRKLIKVEYFFNHPSFAPNNLKSSTDVSTNFSVFYFGWGCLSNVPVYLHYKNSTVVDTINFPMCDKIKIVLPGQ